MFGLREDCMQNTSWYIVCNTIWQIQSLGKVSCWVISQELNTTKFSVNLKSMEFLHSRPFCSMVQQTALIISASYLTHKHRWMLWLNIVQTWDLVFSSVCSDGKMPLKIISVGAGLAGPFLAGPHFRQKSCVDFAPAYYSRTISKVLPTLLKLYQCGTTRHGLQLFWLNSTFQSCCRFSRRSSQSNGKTYQ